MVDHLTIDNIKITKEQFLWFLDNKDSLKRSEIYNIIEILGFTECFSIFSLDNSSRVEYIVKRTFGDGNLECYDARLTMELTNSSKIKMLTCLRNYKITEILI